MMVRIPHDWRHWSLDWFVRDGELPREVFRCAKCKRFTVRRCVFTGRGVSLYAMDPPPRGFCNIPDLNQHVSAIGRAGPVWQINFLEEWFQLTDQMGRPRKVSFSEPWT